MSSFEKLLKFAEKRFEVENRYKVETDEFAKKGLYEELNDGWRNVITYKERFFWEIYSGAQQKCNEEKPNLTFAMAFKGQLEAFSKPVTPISNRQKISAKFNDLAPALISFGIVLTMLAIGLITGLTLGFPVFSVVLLGLSVVAFAVAFHVSIGCCTTKHTQALYHDRDRQRFCEQLLRDPQNAQSIQRVMERQQVDTSQPAESKRLVEPRHTQLFHLNDPESLTENYQCGYGI